MWITSVKNENSYYFFFEAEYGILSLMEKFITLKKTKRQRKHGFLAKSATHNGKKILSRRRSQGRKSLTI
jgi:ribosomal protein L34